MQRLNNIIANRAADTRLNRVLGMVRKAFTFPVMRLRLYLRQFANGRSTQMPGKHLPMLQQHLQMLERHLTAGITAVATAMSWRRSYALCLAGTRRKHAEFRPTPVSSSAFGHRS